MTDGIFLRCLKSMSSFKSHNEQFGGSHIPVCYKCFAIQTLSVANLKATTADIFGINFHARDSNVFIIAPM